MPLNYVTMRLKGLFIIGKLEKILTPGDVTLRVCGPRWG